MKRYEGSIEILFMLYPQEHHRICRLFFVDSSTIEFIECAVFFLVIILILINMAPPVKSNVWTFFIRCDSGGQCKLCDQIVKTKGNTTNLKNHLKRRHKNYDLNKSGESSTTKVTEISNDPTPSTSRMSTNSDANSNSSECEESLNITTINTSTPKSTRKRQLRIDNVISNIQAYQKGGSKELKLTNALLYFITVDDLPLNTTEKKGFQHLMKTVCPTYSVPSRNTITRLIDEKYENISNVIKAQLMQVNSFCLTTDVWTDTMNTRSYLGLTCHFLHKNCLKSIVIAVKELNERHTAEYLKQVIESLCNEWNINVQNILAIVTDNGANIVKAIYELLGKNKHLPCFAHTLNLVVQKAVEETRGFDALVNKVKTIVTFFKHNVSAQDELTKLQKSNNVLPKKLVQDVITRWNSKLYMLQRFIELCDFVSAILLQNPKAPAMLGGNEIAIIKEIINILTPIENVTKEISGQDYVTSSIIIPIIFCMSKSIESANSGSISEVSDLGSEFKAKILSECNKRFKNIEKVHLLAISTILDPRFKKIYFTDAQSCAKSLNDITDLLKTTDYNKDTSPNAQNVVSPDDDDNIWKFHSQLVTETNLNIPKEGLLDDILKQYLREPLLARQGDPITYWTTRSTIWPDLSCLALKYLTIVATSVPSERLFSLAGNTLTDSRNRLDPVRLSKLLFLKSLNAEGWNL